LASHTLSIALKHHQAGALVEAERLYREILVAEPRQADALHLLGVIANQVGNPKLAVELIGEAIGINPLVTTYHNNLANAAKACGEFAKAEASYREALELDRKNVDAHLNLGTLFEEQGRLEEAKKSYEAALRCVPTMARALVSLGRIAGAMGESKLAVRHAKAAVRSAPKSAVAHNALGNALLSVGEEELAKTSYLHAIKIDSGFADAHYNIGNLHRAQGDYAAAVESYQRAIELSPLQADVYNSLGAVFAEIEDPVKAKQAFLHALELDPSYAEAYFNMGSELAKEGEHLKAVEYLDKAIALRPGYSKAYHNLGVSQQALGDLMAATAAYRRALVCGRGVELDDSGAEVQPDQVKTYQNLGAAQQELGDLSAAAEAYRQALVGQPENFDVLCNLASVLVAQGDEEGIALFEELLEEQPDAAHVHWNFGVALLLKGDHARGWREYEWRWKWDKFPSPKRGFSQALWKGEPLAGATILLHAEQGFGDTLQFVRYALFVEQRGGRVILEVQPGLHRLLRDVPGVTECIREGDPLPEFSFHCPLMSLPLMFDTTMETVPPIISGLYRDGGGGVVRGGEEAGELRVGLVWAGNPRHVNDRLRSMSLKDFLPVVEVDDVSFVSLQMGPAAAQIDEGHLPFLLPDALAGVRDFSETASVIAGLDLVITVDTAVAHLAGAMGKPVWILIAKAPDWRWGLHGETTPWYPTARLFRQSVVGGWGELMERVASELALVVGGGKRVEVGCVG
jgi:tetratricopeptide (TPR) repeat protein